MLIVKHVTPVELLKRNAERIRGAQLEFTGEFEIHITVRADSGHDIPRMRAKADVLGMKFLHIILDRGAVPFQPMFTKRSIGTLTSELTAAGDLCRNLAASNLDVVRVKIEASPSNEDVPQTESDARTNLLDRYFEHHVKLLLMESVDTNVLAQIAEAHNAHMSRNPAKTFPDGSAERFITQRCWHVGRLEAQSRLNALIDAITPLGHPILDVEQEYVVYDSNCAIDDGWIREAN